MPELELYLRKLDDIRAPDLWTEIQRRAVAPLPAGAPPRRPWVLSVAVATGVAATLAALIVLLPRPTAAVAVIQEAIGAFPNLPPFRATLVYDHNPAGDDGLGIPPGSTSIVEVAYGGPAAFRFDVVAAQPEGWHTHAYGGTYVVWAGERLGTYLAGFEQFNSYVPGEDFDPLRELSSNAPYPNWEEVCERGGSEVLADTQIAGRPAHHLRCGDWRGGFWELWIDTETGLLLKIVGSLPQDDFRFGTGPSGGFEVTEIVYGSSFEPDTFSVTPPAGVVDLTPGLPEVPPFRAIVSRRVDASVVGATSDWITVDRLWYRPEGGWRRERLEDTLNSGQPFGAGSLWVWDGERLGTYIAYDDAYSQEPFAEGTMVPDPEHPLYQLSPSFWNWTPGLSSEDYFNQQCEQTGIEEVAGRPARHLTCEVGSQIAGTAHEIWLDAETGLFLEFTNAFEHLEVLEIEYDPVFPADLFTFVPPPGSRSYDELTADPYTMSSLKQGEVAPTWSGQLLDGAVLDLKEIRGKPVLVLFWADWCPPADAACFVLPQFEEVFTRWSERVALISVDWGGLAEEARRIVEAGGYTFPVVGDEDGSIGEAWGIQGVPFWVLLDEEGRVLEARVKPQTVEQLEEMLGQVDR